MSCQSAERSLAAAQHGEPLDPAVKEYVRYVLSREGQRAVMEDGKWLPLTAEVVRKQLAKLD